MKILSFNVRGLGKRAKRREIREMLKKFKIEFCCIQETKLEKIGDRICRGLCGDQNFGWAYVDAEGKSGGILSIWDDRVFCMMSSWFVKGVLVVNGFSRENGDQVCILNVYAPCSFSKKSVLWDIVGNNLAQNRNILTCIAGDFNAIRSEDERVGRGLAVDYRDMAAFDDFIRQANLFDCPLTGRKFTWYKKDGSCKSKLDRILVNEEWLIKWPSYSVKSCGRTFSDHCPIYFEMVVKDWGPRPFKFINSWISHPEFSSFVKGRWEGHKIVGWAGFRLKEKLKLIKADLKEWNRLVFGNIDNQIEEKKMG